MKKTLVIFLTMAMLVCAVPHIAFAATVTDNGLIYELDDSGQTATLTNGKGASSNSVVIPNEVRCGGNDYDVTSIGSEAFINCSSLTSVKIPDNVTTIGNRVFSGCSGLTSVNIGSGLTSIGENVFNTCNSLTTINVDAGNKNFKVEDDVLFNMAGTRLILCSRGKAGSYDIPIKVKSIDNKAFCYCMGLESITIPNGVTTIADSTFFSCDSLTSVEIPDSVTTIEGNAFSYCPLESIKIPKNVTSIGIGAFANCDNLTSVAIGSNVTTIDTYAFSNCSDLTSITIPCDFDKAKFKNTSITVGNNNTFTNSGGGSGSFELAHDWGEWKITKEPTDITAGEQTRSCKRAGCGVSQNEPTGITYTLDESNKTAEITDGKGATGAVVIPGSIIHDGNDYKVTSIGTSAFYGRSSLMSVEIPDSVTTIGGGAFWNCSSLRSVKIGSGVTSIGYGAFWNCGELESVTIPNSTLSIGLRAFDNCSSLTSVTIPDSVTTIGTDAFSNCSNLTSVTIPDSVTTVGSGVFSNCGSLGSVTIGNSVTTIGTDAFSNCSNLTSVTIPDSVTTIGGSAFENCSNLTSITIPCDFDKAKFKKTSITVGNNNTFTNSGGGSGSFGLAHDWGEWKITKEPTCTDAGERTRSCTRAGCSVSQTEPIELVGHDLGHAQNNIIYTLDKSNQVAELTNGKSATGELVIYEKVNCSGNDYSVTSISGGAFSGCTAMTSIVIPDSVTLIGNGAFSGCSDLTSIMVSDTFDKSKFNNTGIVVGDNNTFTNSGGKSGSFGVIYIKDNIKYNLDKSNKTAELICGNEATGELVIPKDFTYIGPALDSIGKYTVTAIDERAFHSCKNLTSVKIPDSVTTIGAHAFSDCSGLTSVTIGNSVTTIGNGAFWNCGELESVTIPDSVTTIGAHAFGYCHSLTSVTIGNSVTTIGKGTFSGCNSMTSVTIGSSVTTIDGSAFENCNRLESINVDSENQHFKSNEGVLFDFDKVGSRLIFCPCGRKGSYTIPFGVITIGVRAFLGCSSLASVTIPFSVESIGNDAFNGCSSLTSVTIPNSVTSIGERAFGGCSGLKSVTIGSGMTSISTSWLPKDLASLESITVGSGINGISLLRYYRGLKSINVDPNNPEFKSENGVVLSKDGRGLLLYPRRRTGSYTISDSVETICDNAFDTCDNLTSIRIGSGVTSVGKGAFSGCTALTSVAIPDSVNSIGDNAFSNCSNLRSVAISDSVNSIGGNAFSNCSSLRSVAIPDSVDSIGHGAFSECGSLESVAIGRGVTTIGNNAFNSCNSLTSITIPDSVTTIGADAFAYCSSLTSVAIPGSVKAIYGSAFAYCSSLKSVTIGSGVTTIGEYAFSNCSSLESVTIPGSVSAIGERAFFHCGSLVLITIPCNFDRRILLYTGLSCIGFNTFVNYHGGEGILGLRHPSLEYKANVEPDCVTAGKQAHWTCEQCKGLFIDGDGMTRVKDDDLWTRPALGHAWGEWKITKEPICTDAGERTRFCTRVGCNASQTEPIAIMGHDWDTDGVTTAATPEKPGVKTYTCSRCKETKTEPVEYVSVPDGVGSSSTNLHPDAGGGDSNSSNSYSDVKPAAMAKRATIKTGDQMGLLMMTCMAVLLVSAYGVLVGVKSRRKKHWK